jgi:hypothetical protein
LGAHRLSSVGVERPGELGQRRPDDPRDPRAARALSRLQSLHRALPAHQPGGSRRQRQRERRLAHNRRRELSRHLSHGAREVARVQVLLLLRPVVLELLLEGSPSRGGTELPDLVHLREHLLRRRLDGIQEGLLQVWIILKSLPYPGLVGGNLVEPSQQVGLRLGHAGGRQCAESTDDEIHGRVRDGPTPSTA